MPKAKNLYREIGRAALVGLTMNFALGVIKLAAGLATQSTALISDAVNSLGDTLTSIAILVALRYAALPADDEHPYGHTRLESVAASHVALVVVLSAAYVGIEAAFNLFKPHPMPPTWTLWIAGSNAVIKELLYRYKVRVAGRTGSMAMIANAWDHRADAFCSLAVLAGLSAVRYGGPQFIWADEVAALVVVVAICWSGGMVLKRSVSDLLDPQANEELVREIRQRAEAVPGVNAVEKLWVRKTGIEYLADIHIQVERTMTVEEGHRIGHHVKDELLAHFLTVRDVLVHLEPFPHHHRPE